MKVTVLVAGIYNGPGHRALPWAEAEAVVEVASGPYGDELVRQGLVRSFAAAAASAQDDSEGRPGPSEAQVAAGPGETPGRPRRRRGHGDGETG